MRFRILLAVLLAAGAAHADTLEEIARLEREISVATWTGDRVWFEENLADDFILLTPNGDVRTRPEFIRGLVRAGLKMEPYDTTDVQVRVYGDAAIVTGRMQQTYSLGRARYQSDLRYTHVYAKRKGRWSLVTAHSSAVK